MSQAAHFTYLPELAGADQRPVSIAIFGAVAGMLSGLAPVLWGFALRGGGDAPGIDAEVFSAFFCTVIALSSLAIWRLESLPDSRLGVAR